MPQLDKFAFFSQFVFLVIILGSVFLLINLYIIPNIKSNLVFRMQKIISLIEKAKIFEKVFVNFIFFNLGLKRIFSSITKIEKKSI
jgi:hypothetical protein